MTRYTIAELKKLSDFRLAGFNIKESLDDRYTNDYQDFEANMTIFIEWLAKMEKENKIDSILNNK
jgi:hypothetical protein